MWNRALPGALLCLCVACGGAPAPASRDVIVWRDVGAWSGRGLLQTSPFENDTGILRIGWNARDAAADRDGMFRISLHSAVSGRSLSVPVDRRGAGSGTAFVNEDPRGFYLVIESKGIEWTVDVDEGIPARQVARR